LRHQDAIGVVEFLQRGLPKSADTTQIDGMVGVAFDLTRIAIDYPDLYAAAC
jgi:hypothetical protein